MKRPCDLGRVGEFKYSTVILGLLLHVFGPWETVIRIQNPHFSKETQVLIQTFQLKADKRIEEKGSTSFSTFG